MTANEFRIGNLTYRTDVHKCKTVIDKLNIYDIERIENNATNSFVYEPIKLDDEWFLICKSNSIFNNGFDYKKTTKGRYNICVNGFVITILEFVHELQNLNFALLGEEINFKNL
jgi:hypothetical protein